MRLLNTFNTLSFRLTALTVVGLLSFPAFSLTINVGELSVAPVLDGSTDDWAGISGTTIHLKNYKPGGKTQIPSVDVKSAVKGEYIYFLFEWKDNTEDAQHKPFVWDEGANKYVSGKQREDRLAIQFGMSGDYDVNWLSGNLFTADIWHWKAARSNGLGIAQDKMTIVSAEKMKKSFEGKGANGATIFIQRPSDKGSKLYKTARYATKEADIMPKYILEPSVSGSIADVKAKGVWRDGKWTLELSRKMDTGNPDDVVFKSGESVPGGVAVFNHSGDDDHGISELITFQF